MLNVESKTLQKELKYKGEVILKYTIEYPQVTENKWIIASKRFNIFNYKKAILLRKEAESRLFEEAKELYEYNKKNGYPIMVYELYYTFKVTYITDNIVSLYTDKYMYTGGAHGSTIRESQNWDFRIARQVPLKDLFPNNPNYVQNILVQINKKIEQDIQNGNNIYFDNYCCLTVETFSVYNYYLEKGNIVIYYQQYDIAPYSSGILTFEIKE